MKCGYAVVRSTLCIVVITLAASARAQSAPEPHREMIPRAMHEQIRILAGNDEAQIKQLEEVYDTYCRDWVELDLAREQMQVWLIGHEQVYWLLQGELDDTVLSVVNHPRRATIVAERERSRLDKWYFEEVRQSLGISRADIEPFALRQRRNVYGHLVQFDLEWWVKSKGIVAEPNTSIANVLDEWSRDVDATLIACDDEPFESLQFAYQQAVTHDDRDRCYAKYHEVVRRTFLLRKACRDGVRKLAPLLDRALADELCLELDRALYGDSARILATELRTEVLGDFVLSEEQINAFNERLNQYLREDAVLQAEQRRAVDDSLTPAGIAREAEYWTSRLFREPLGGRKPEAHEINERRSRLYSDFWADIRINVLEQELYW